METITYRVRRLVRGWKVEAVGPAGRSTHCETKADALRTAHLMARGTLDRIVVLDEQGRVESRFPFAAQEFDGA